MAGIMDALGGLFGNNEVPNLSEDAFAAADAANLASQGIGQGQMYSALQQAGAPDAAFLTADASQLAGQGLNQAQIEQNLNPTAQPSSKPFDIKGIANDYLKKQKEMAATQKKQAAPKAVEGKQIDMSAFAPKPMGMPAMQTIQGFGGFSGQPIGIMNMLNKQGG